MDQKKLSVSERLVTPYNFHQITQSLSAQSFLALDTETTGLRPHHGDKIFALIISYAERNSGPYDYVSYYFNFNDTKDAPSCLGPGAFAELQKILFNCPDILWYIHNAKFDMAMLKKEGCELVGPIHCTRAQARVENNSHMSYSLNNVGKRLGYGKDDAVENYIKQHKLWDWVTVPSKSIRQKNKHYDRVPFEIMFKYACTDAALCCHIGGSQTQALRQLDRQARENKVPGIWNIVENERKLTHLVFDMEYQGLKINRDYSLLAAVKEAVRAETARRLFTLHTGYEYKASPILFAEVFYAQRDQWEFTEKGNPSFESDILKKFDCKAAKAVLTIRDAKSRQDFYNGFLWHADKDDFIHPNFNPDGTATGRFSSSEPNFQNLTSENATEEFIVRRSIIPSEPGGCLISLDYDQMEYRMMLDLSCNLLKEETQLVRDIRDGGLDVHTAVASLAGVTREEAKTTNFLTIYGGGDAKLADQLCCTLEQAKKIRGAIFDAAPEIRNFIRAVTRAAENRGFIFNWAGRRCYFPDKKFAYKAPNHLIQGGCADVVKFAMPKIQDYLDAYYPGVRIYLQVHDELILDVPAKWVVYRQELVYSVKTIMESVYPAKYLPLTVGAEWSMKSLGDMEKFKDERGAEVSDKSSVAVS